MADVKSRCVRLLAFAACWSDRASWYSAVVFKVYTHMPNAKHHTHDITPHPHQLPPHKQRRKTQSGRTNTIGIPLWPDVLRVPELAREVGRALVDVNELDELRVQVRVAEGAVRHERVVEVLRRHAALEGVELGELRLLDVTG